METSVDAWASAISRMVPNDHPSLRDAYANGDTRYFDNQNLPVPAIVVEHKIPWVELWQEHGTDTTTLSNIMGIYAFVSEATKAGYEVSDEEVQAAIAAYRLAFDAATEQPLTRLEPSDEPADTYKVEYTHQTINHKLIAYIEVVGEDVYWETILPIKMRRELLGGKWTYHEATKGIDDHEEMLDAVRLLHENARRDTEVEFTDAFPLETTLDKVRAFQRDHEELGPMW